MNLENQVCSLELAKKLKELGVKQESLFWWNGNKEWVDKEVKQLGGGVSIVKMLDEELHWEITRCVSQSPSCRESYSAFTVAELGEMLPKWYSSHLDVKKGEGDEGIGDVWVCTPPRGDIEKIGSFEGAATEADARAKMLVYLLENGLIKN